jgi:hypothetical protein
MKSLIFLKQIQNQLGQKVQQSLNLNTKKPAFGRENKQTPSYL